MDTDFNLKNIDGEFVSLSDYPEANGFVVVFTCNHCPYAVAYEVRLVELSEQVKKMGFPLIAINPNDASRYPMDSYEQMQVRAAQRGFNFPYLHDETQEIAKNYGATRTPHAFVLKRKDNGELEMVYEGAIDDNWQHANAVTVNYITSAITNIKAGQLPNAHAPAVGCTIKCKM